MRTNNTIKNIFTGLTVQIVTILLGFISRKVFISNMGIELLGINGLLSNVLSMLSLVELGIGTAIYYSLYKPLAEDDFDKVHAIMNLYSKMYKCISIAVAILGICIMPLLKKVVETDISMSYVNTVYLIFLIDSVISYFLAYRRNILSADQKSYVLNKLSMIFSVSLTLSQIVVILATKNYILYLLIKVVLVFVQNIIMYFMTNKRYPYLKNKSVKPLDAETKGEIIKNAKALFIVNISVYCVGGTDNILLSSFAGITVVGLYSNYYLLINTVNGLLRQIFNGVQASFGNFLVKNSLEEARGVFNVLYFINFWVSSFSAISLVVLLNPFIKIWLGKEMLIPILAVCIIVFNFHSRSMTSAIETVRAASGLYSPYPFFKYWALVEGILNLVISIILAGPLKWGMYGVFFGTSISTFITVFVLPWNVYKYVFGFSSKEYYKKYFIYEMLGVILTFITYKVAYFFTLDNLILDIAIKGLVCISLPNIIIGLLFYKTKEFKCILDKLGIYKRIENFRTEKITRSLEQKGKV